MSAHFNAFPDSVNVLILSVHPCVYGLLESLAPGDFFFFSRMIFPLSKLNFKVIEFVMKIKNSRHSEIIPI